MNCKDLTYEHHKVELTGTSISAAMSMGLVGLHWVKVHGQALLRGKIGTRELFDKVMADPKHFLHAAPCSCGSR